MRGCDDDEDTVLYKEKNERPPGGEELWIVGCRDIWVITIIIVSNFRKKDWPQASRPDGSGPCRKVQRINWLRHAKIFLLSPDTGENEKTWIKIEQDSSLASGSSSSSSRCKSYLEADQRTAVSLAINSKPNRRWYYGIWKGGLLEEEKKKRESQISTLKAGRWKKERRIEKWKFGANFNTSPKRVLGAAARRRRMAGYYTVAAISFQSRLNEPACLPAQSRSDPQFFVISGAAIIVGRSSFYTAAASRVGTSGEEEEEDRRRRRRSSDFCELFVSPPGAERLDERQGQHAFCTCIIQQQQGHAFHHKRAT